MACTETNPMFQSAPLTKARGDSDAPATRTPNTEFQSAPLTKARGDCPNWTYPSADRLVSIRSPHQSKGRPVLSGAYQAAPSVSIRSPHQSKGRLSRSLTKNTLPLFQSAPLTKARGDLIARRIGFAQLQVSIRSPHQSKGRHGPLFPTGLRPPCFNPLPSPKQGETRHVFLACLGVKVSIRSPHQSKGRLVIELLVDRLFAVSIRSPHQSKGRPRSGRAS